MVLKRAPTAYFLFAEEQRSIVRDELVSKVEGGKVSVAEVAKVIGEKWRNLSDGDKQKYKDLAQKAAEQFKADQELRQAEEADQPQAEPADVSDPQPAAQLPFSLVKRIILLDKDVGRVSGDGLKLIASSAELFLEMLTAKGVAASKASKRRTVKLEDFESTLKYDKRLGEMGIKGVLEDCKQSVQAANAEKEAQKAAAATEGDDGETAEPAAKKQKTGKGVEGGKQRITTFFSRNS